MALFGGLRSLFSEASRSTRCAEPLASIHDSAGRPVRGEQRGMRQGCMGNRIATSGHVMALLAMTHGRTVRLISSCNRSKNQRPLQCHCEEERSDDVAIRFLARFFSTFRKRHPFDSPVRTTFNKNLDYSQGFYYVQGL